MARLSRHRSIAIQVDGDIFRLENSCLIFELIKCSSPCDSSTSDMDKVGLKHQYGHIKAAFAPATMICGAIGLSRDVFNVHQDMRQAPAFVKTCLFN